MTTDDALEGAIALNEANREERAARKARSRDPLFRLVEAGVERQVEDGEGSRWRWICSPLELLAITRNAEGRDWGRLLRVTTPDGQHHDWPMPMELLAGDGTVYRAELLRLGLILAPGKFARDALHEYIATARPDLRVRCVSRVGWHGRVFVLPEAVFGGSGAEQTVLQHVAPTQHAFRTAGTLEGWQERVAGPCAGNTRLVLSVSAAFAAPLLHLVGAESGGFHFRGASSTGKTTALLAAGSVWGGGGLTGCVRQWRATDNGLEAVAAHHCDALLCLDELSQVDPRAAGLAAYMLANGTGKTRAGRSGEGRAPAEWRILFLSTGEIGLADKLTEDGRARRLTAGQQVRVVDVPADAGAGLGLFETLHGPTLAGDFARLLKNAASECYGTAGRAFVAKIVEDPDGVTEAITGFRDEYLGEHCPPGADGQVSRVAARFGLVAAAGELAVALRILPWSRGEAAAAASACFRAWLEARGGDGAAEVSEGIRQVRRFLEQHGESRFAPWEMAGSGDRPTINRAGFRRPTDDGGVEFYILPETWRSEVCAGFDARAMARALVERGFLIPDPGDGKPQSRHRLPGMAGVVRCYRLSSDILGADNA